jgi:hypothetical protein
MNLKKSLAQITFYLFIAIFLIGIVILYVGIEGNSMLVKIGISILTPYYLYLGFIIVKAKKSETQNELIKQEYTNSSEKTFINLQKVEIKSSKWIEKMVADNSFEAKLSYLSDTGGTNILIKKSTNFVTLKIPYKKSMIEYDIEIGIDLTSLKLHFEAQKEAEFYYDPKNPKSKYLNLNFLNQTK